ncbi:replication initiator [Microbacterium sp. NPDC077644]|uniref:replication initiator n=1 Tax=Microbacterium sp. NPDC077644 TaxID=3155055 RepID=UPI00344B5E9F
MRADSETIDPGAAEVLARGCSSPVKTATGVWVRCGSRIKSRCASCAELYRGDWAAIARSGVFDGPVEQFSFYLLTLTAPSFGQVHRVPRSGVPVRCGCGSRHSARDAGLRGVPLNAATYDYVGQVAWNRDAGVLWDRTRRRLRDRWSTLEYFIVREWQDRGVLHIHAIIRIARREAPSATSVRDAARTATAISRVDGSLVEWGTQAKCDAFRADGDGAKTIWYLSKALNYVLKDVATDADDVPVAVWHHQVALDDAARRMRCGVTCEPQNCSGLVHQRYGSRSQVVSASRRTRSRVGWSFTGLTRTVQRQMRRAWWEMRSHTPDAPKPAPAPTALENVAARARREVVTRGPSAP